YINGKPSPYDDYGHGTSVASIAVGDGIGGPTAGLMKGVAPAADLSAAKVLDATGSGDDSFGILGIQWCANRASVDVISLSLGSAAAGSASGCVAGQQGTGTSFATPFVSGLAALLRQKQPTWTQANVRADIEGTAFDVGPPGKDNEWGAGLLDGYEAVAQAAGATGQTPFPSYQRLTGSVPNFGTTTETFTLGAGDLGAPIAATIT